MYIWLISVKRKPELNHSASGRNRFYSETITMKGRDLTIELYKYDSICSMDKRGYSQAGCGSMNGKLRGNIKSGRGDSD